jgi:hypothetical protein
VRLSFVIYDGLITLDAIVAKALQPRERMSQEKEKTPCP